MTHQKPRTKAGRIFLDQLVEEWEGEYGDDRPEASAKVRAELAATIAAIEAEAVLGIRIEPLDADRIERIETAEDFANAIADSIKFAWDAE